MTEYLIFSWIKSHVAETISLVISFVSLITAASLGRREKPNIMPVAHSVRNGAHFITDFLNTSSYNILNLTILIHKFSEEEEEILPPIEDKFLFTVGEKTQFHYLFNITDLPPSANKSLYFRVFFRGNYHTRFPIFSKRSFQQYLWISLIPTSINPVEGNKVEISYEVFNTHKPKIDLLNNKYHDKFVSDQKRLDKKF